MKKLLTTITLSALVGTSASNLKPVFTNNVVNHGFKSNQVNTNKDINIKNQNNTNPFINKIPTIDDNSNISSNVISSNGTIYLSTYNKGLWKSTDGIKFEQVTGLPNDVSAISYFNNTIYVGMENKGLWKSTDGIKFERVTGLPNNFIIQKIHITSNGTIYVGSQESGLWKSTDEITFERVTGLSNDKIRSIESNSNLIIIGFNNGEIYQSNDGCHYRIKISHQLSSENFPKVKLYKQLIN